MMPTRRELFVAAFCIWLGRTLSVAPNGWDLVIGWALVGVMITAGLLSDRPPPATKKENQ